MEGVPRSHEPSGRLQSTRYGWTRATATHASGKRKPRSLEIRGLWAIIHAGFPSSGGILITEVAPDPSPGNRSNVSGSRSEARLARMRRTVSGARRIPSRPGNYCRTSPSTWPKESAPETVFRNSRWIGLCSLTVATTRLPSSRSQRP